jgi:DNA-directed RNA polymerase alpha subunit
MLNTRKCKIASRHSNEIIKYFQAKIENCKSNGTPSVDEIEKEIKNSGLNDNIIKKLISMLPKETEKNEEFEEFRTRVLSKIGFPHRATEIDDLNISDKAKMAFENAGFKTVGDIIKFNKNELFKFGNIQRF